MGFRFRRSIKILPGVRVNLSKSGISTSRVPGATVNIGTRGTKATVGLPGTGFSYSERVVEPLRPKPLPELRKDRDRAWLIEVGAALAVVMMIVLISFNA